MNKNKKLIIEDNLAIAKRIYDIIKINNVPNSPTLTLGFEDDIEEKIIPQIHNLFKARYSNQKNISQPTIICEQTRLPFKDNSISLIIIKNNYLFYLNYNEVLREIWRVLENEGHIIILTKNKITTGLLHKENSNHTEPRYNHAQIKNMMANHLFQVRTMQNFLLSFAFGRKYLPKTVNFIEKSPNIFTPMMGCLIICLAQKRVIQPITSSIADKKISDVCTIFNE